ncbi:hypothetical protein BN2537_7129 [Streptomyces venezuelae]|nr:hypothetical protein BN2537_7129 [Streptomyces venezuelae]
MLRPAGQECLEEAGDRRLADGDGAGDPYDEGCAALLRALAEEGVEGAAETAGGLHVEVEQPGEREVDVPHLVEVDDVPEAAEPLDLVGGEGEGRLVAEVAPLGAGEVDVRGRLGRAAVAGAVPGVPGAGPCPGPCSGPSPGPSPLVLRGGEVITQPLSWVGGLRGPWGRSRDKSLCPAVGGG